MLSRVIFVSSELYKGEFGGVVGADAKCKLLAATAGLLRPEKFRAWLSDGQTSPSAWILDTEKRYQLPSGTVIADNWSGLTSGSLKASINQTEMGLMLNGGALTSVWTGTLTDGSAGGPSCNGWTDPTDSFQAKTGVSIFSDSRWTDFVSQKCQSAARLYCVEVW